jgi:hypothetical protein
MNPLEYQTLLGYVYFGIAGYTLIALARDVSRWFSKMKEEEQLNRATFVREGSKHFYLIRKVTEYQIFVDERLIGSAETLRSAQEKGELEVSDRDLVDQGLPDSKAISKMIADLGKS